MDKPSELHDFLQKLKNNHLEISDEQEEPKTASLYTLLKSVRPQTDKLIGSLEPKINAALKEEFLKDGMETDGLDEILMVKISAEVKTMVTGLVKALCTQCGLEATNSDGEEIIKEFINSLEMVATLEAEEIHPDPMPATRTATIISDY